MSDGVGIQVSVAEGPDAGIAAGFARLGADPVRRATLLDAASLPEDLLRFDSLLDAAPVIRDA